MRRKNFYTAHAVKLNRLAWTISTFGIRHVLFSGIWILLAWIPFHIYLDIRLWLEYNMHYFCARLYECIVYRVWVLIRSISMTILLYCILLDLSLISYIRIFFLIREPVRFSTCFSSTTLFHLLDRNISFTHMCTYTYTHKYHETHYSVINDRWGKQQSNTETHEHYQSHSVLFCVQVTPAYRSNTLYRGNNSNINRNPKKGSQCTRWLPTHKLKTISTSLNMHTCLKPMQPHVYNATCTFYNQPNPAWFSKKIVTVSSAQLISFDHLKIDHNQWLG